MRWHHRNYPGFTLVESIVVLVVIGVVIALLMPAIQTARESARRLNCQNNLKQQGIAAQGYHLTHEELPAESYYDGTPSYTEEEDEVALDIEHASYRVRLLPYIGLPIIQDVVGRSETAEGIEDLSRMSIPTFLCPSATGKTADIGSPLRYVSHYYGIAGALGKSPLGGQYSVDPVQKEYLIDVHSLGENVTMEGNIVLGPFANTGTIIVGGGVTIASIQDGLSNTMLVGEISWKEYGAHRNWVRGTAITSRRAFLPDGIKVPFPYTQLTSAKGIAENFPINIGKRQERVVQDFVSVPIADDLENNAEAAEPAPLIPDFITLIVPVRGRGAGHGISGFGSNHVNGVNFCYADGTVHFLNEKTETTNLMSLATRQGSEVIALP